jgi:hypothetical protein
MKIAKVKVDAEHTLRLLEGKPVGICVPAGTEVLELKLEPQAKDRNYLAEVVDVFFNGRKAT